MGKKRIGIKARPTSIEINFTYQGKRFYESIKRRPTETNLDNAAALRKRIKQEIDLGIFNPHDYALDYPHWTVLQHTAEQAPRLFFEAAELYLSNYKDRKTRSGYLGALNRTWSPLFEMPISEITYADILQCSKRLDDKSNKHFNNERLPLLGVFKLAKKLNWIHENVAEELEPKKNEKPQPDPFSQNEAEQIIQYFYKNHGEIFGAYLETAFFTGLRNPSEIIALTWKNLKRYDSNLYAHINQRRTLGELKAGTKTGNSRDVFLIERAQQAIARMHQHTPTSESISNTHFHPREIETLNKLSKEGHTPQDFIFINPNTGLPLMSGDDANKKWRAALSTLDIRHRKMYNTRHTYATYMLESGIDPADAADELGHSPTMFLTVYTKFINRKSRAAKMMKLNSSGH